MADVKISQLTALASASVDVAADVLAVVDTSVPQTKKLSVENLLAPITINKASGVITNLGTVTTADINGGTIDGSVIGGATPAAGTFTTVTASGNIVMGDDTSIGIADDAERIEFDGAGDISVLGANFGIGTTAPANKFTVSDGTRMFGVFMDGSTLNFREHISDNTATGSDWLVHKFDGSGTYFPANAGGIGIEQSSPSSPASANAFLHIGSSSLADASLVLEDDNNKWEILSNDSLHFRDGTTNRIVINSSGNVGIGTSAPAGRLSIVNTDSNGSGLIVSSANNADQSSPLVDISTSDTAFDQEVLRVINTGTNTGVFLDQRGNGRALYCYSDVNADAGDPLVSITADNALYDQPVLQVKNDGINNSLSIQNTGTNTAVHISQTGTGATTHFESTASNSSSGMVYIQNSHGSDPFGLKIDFSNAAPNNTGTEWFIYGEDSEGSEFNIWADGSFVQTSDRRRKENIADSSNKLNQINQLRVVDYNRIGDTHQHLGLISQEVEEIFPHLVSIAPDEDKYPEGEGGTKMLYKIGMIPLLIKAVQELSAKVEALENA